MDVINLEDFRSDNFDSIQWVNSMLSECTQDGGSENTEQYLASMSMRLHLTSEDYADQLETSMVEAMSSTPRLLSDISRIEDKLQSFEEEMKNLSVQLRTFDQRNVAGVEDLSRLDTLKSNMEKCKSTLEEHARWGRLGHEAKSFMQGGGKLSKSADRIEALYTSLDVLKDMPGHQDRVTLCKELSEALLTALRPRVRKDISGSNVSILSDYMYVYEKLQRKDEFEAEYVRARPERLRGDAVIPANLSSGKFGAWLATFYGKVTGLLLEEETNAATLFEQDRVPDILCLMIQSAMKLMCDSNTNTNTESKNMTTNFLETPYAKDLPQHKLVEVYGVTEEFARRTFKIFKNASSKCLADSLDSVFRPFWDHLPIFMENEAILAAKALSENLKNVMLIKNGYGSDTGAASGTVLDDQGGEIEPFAILDNFTEEVLLAAEGFADIILTSLKRCSSLFAGYHIQFIVETLLSSLANHILVLSGRVNELHNAFGLDETITNTDGRSGVINSGSDSDRKSSLDLYSKLRAEGSDAAMTGRANDLLPYALRSLQAAGKIMANLQIVENAVRDCFEEILENLGNLPVTSNIAISAYLNDTSEVSFGSVYAGHMLGKDSEALSRLRILISGADTTSRISTSASMLVSTTTSNYNNVPLPLKVFRTTTDAAAQFTRIAGSLLLEICIALPRKSLAHVSSEAIWASRLSTQIDPVDILPQLSFTQVGEHLLGLVQDLEAFAASLALSDLLNISRNHCSEKRDSRRLEDDGKYMEQLVKRDWEACARNSSRGKDMNEMNILLNADTFGVLSNRFAASTAVINMEKAILGKESDDSKRFRGNEEEYERERGTSKHDINDNTGTGAEEEIEKEENVEMATLTLVNDWLCSIADVIVGLLFCQILSIKKITSSGRRQLETDVTYIRNVISALGLLPHPLLTHLLTLLTACQGQGQAQGQGLGKSREETLFTAVDAATPFSTADGALKEVDKRILALLV
jgi:hypothetical protein